MPLNVGSRLGPYEIVAPIGAGGMGEVYRGRDTRLDRVVAIKVLSEHLSESAEGRERFLREAKTISRLSHGNICALYDVGQQDGVDFLVMEYIEGETLAERLTKGPLPIEQVLRYGVEIADALDRAHRQRIVHRDLKPGNLMLTRSGIKLLDFGLAKLQARPTGVLAPQMSGMATDPGGLTTAGTIVGTLQYMAPEQLEGGEADARSDIFAFGVILYEMTTGHKAFTGSSHASVIANILKSEPQPIFSLTPLVPPPLERLIRRCLAKDPDDRWQTARDLTLELKAMAGEPALATSPSLAASAPAVPPSTASTAASAVRPGVSRETLAWGLAAAATVAAAVLAFLLTRRAPQAPAGPAMRFLVSAPENAIFDVIDAPATISPDGTRLLFGATGPDGRPILWVRPLDAITARPLLATDDARDPFWSPDGRSIAFFGEGKLKRMDANGGPPATICEAPDPRGGAWGRDGVIVFAPNARGPLMRVKAEGSEPSPATALDAERHETAHGYPQFLPDGKRFLYLVRSADSQQDGIYSGSTVSRSSSLVLTSAVRAVYADPGWLLYLREGALMAQPFDASAARLSGAPRRLEAGVASVPEIGGAAFSASGNGVLAYQTALDPEKQLTWVDRSGRRLATVGLPGHYRGIEISPDGRLAAVERVDPRKHSVDIWRFDLSRGEGSPLADGAVIEQGPAWSPDGTRVFYGSNPEGAFQICEKDAAGGSAERVLFASPQWKMPSDVARDGKLVLYQAYDLTTKRDVWTLPLTGPRKPAPFLRSEASEWQARFSPDGRSVAYTSDETGRHEVYVAAYPGPGGKTRVSKDGGTLPRWRADGKELYFVGGDGTLMAAAVESASPFRAGTPASLLETRGAASYAVSADGERFLLAAPVVRASEASITVVANWPAFLPR